MRSRVLAALAIVVPLVFLRAPAAGAAVTLCAEYDVQGFCLEWDQSEPEDADRDNSQRPGSSSPLNAVVCYWRTLDEVPASAIDSGFLPTAPTGVPLVWQERVCSDGSQGSDPLANVRWAVAAVPDPVDLAGAARARIAGRLPSPNVDTSPPPGVAAIVDVPAFVSVSNWTGTVQESECGAGLCVTVEASPELEFSPGEPGSSPITCRGSGTSHRPGGDAADEASSPGACAHRYRLRTGTAGRPTSWSGVVTVTWTITWAASSGASDTLPSVVLTSPLPRAVSEVQAPIVDGAVP